MSMLHQSTSNMTHLFSRILEGCRHRNNSEIGTALNALMQRSRNSRHYSEQYIKLYQVCLLYLRLNRIDEIRKTIARLAKDWEKTVLRITANRIGRESDLEVEQISEEIILLRTKDAVIASRLQAVRGIKLDIIEKLPTGEMNWNYLTPLRGLKQKLEKVRQPHYLEFLSKKESRQLSLEL